MTIFAQIKDKKLLTDYDHINDWAQTQKNGQYEIEITRKRKSNQTMRYYYKILHILAKGLGYFDDELKAMLKTKLHHYVEIQNPEGENVVRYFSTADYTQEQFNDAIELIMYWGSINNIYIQSSEEWKEQFNLEKMV